LDIRIDTTYKALDAFASHKQMGMLRMVLEIAILDVKPGQESSFEGDFSVASGCITTVNGYISHELYSLPGEAQ
jgi:hypothetical protein